ncbi:hypothetical protein ACLKA7_015453 [Drosophila subpalustris]
MTTTTIGWITIFAACPNASLRLSHQLVSFFRGKLIGNATSTRHRLGQMLKHRSWRGDMETGEEKILKLKQQQRQRTLTSRHANYGHESNPPFSRQQHFELSTASPDLAQLCLGLGNMACLAECGFCSLLLAFIALAELRRQHDKCRCSLVPKQEVGQGQDQCQQTGPAYHAKWSTMFVVLVLPLATCISMFQ